MGGRRSRWEWPHALKPWADAHGRGTLGQEAGRAGNERSRRCGRDDEGVTLLGWHEGLCLTGAMLSCVESSEQRVLSQGSPGASAAGN